jgi:hypothetical protein
MKQHYILALIKGEEETSKVAYALQFKKSCTVSSRMTV